MEPQALQSGQLTYLRWQGTQEVASKAQPAQLQTG